MLVNMTALGLKHSRRIYTEEHTKIFAAVWGDRIYFILFTILAALAILHQDDLKNKMNPSFSSYHPAAKQVARQGVE